MPLIFLQLLAMFAAICTVTTGVCKLAAVIQKWRRESRERKNAAMPKLDEVAFAVAGPEIAAGAAVEPVNNLPLPLTAIVGRHAEQAELRDLLVNKQSRLVTLTGPGGVGKTRLALEVAHEVAASFADGVVFIPLATVQSCDDVCRAGGGQCLRVYGNDSSNPCVALSAPSCAQTARYDDICVCSL